MKEVGTNTTVSTVIDAGTKIGATTSQSGSTGMIMGDYDLGEEGLCEVYVSAQRFPDIPGRHRAHLRSGGVSRGLWLEPLTPCRRRLAARWSTALSAESRDLNALVQVFVIKSYDVVN